MLMSGWWKRGAVSSPALPRTRRKTCSQSGLMMGAVSRSSRTATARLVCIRREPQASPARSCCSTLATSAGIAQRLVAGWSVSAVLTYAGGTGADLWVLPLRGGGKSLPVIHTESGQRDGQFSPDGKWVAYSSNSSGRSEVYVQPFPRPVSRDTSVYRRWCAGALAARWARAVLHWPGRTPHGGSDSDCWGQPARPRRPRRALHRARWLFREPRGAGRAVTSCPPTDSRF